jgi:hypothetical protein
MEYGKNIFLEEDILQQLAKHSGKCVMHLKAVGLLESNADVDEDEVWEFYLGKCPTNVLNILRQFKEAYCFLETNESAIHAFEEWFPSKKDLLEEEMHYYVRVHMVSSDFSINAVNE